MKREKIDIVITWVDGKDPEWLREKKKWADLQHNPFEIDEAVTRYRNWNNLQYVFRGIEKFMPWVHTVHFVTWGHLPKWLNTNHSKLHVVRHDEFIPDKYLPTFNSNAIELNQFRIDQLAEQFINFNDDMFVIKPCVPTDFFEDGYPKDFACVSPQPIYRDVAMNIELNNTEILNDHFSRQDIRRHWDKWLNPFLYGGMTVRTAVFLQFSTILGLFEPHIPIAYTKSAFETVWREEAAAMDACCSNRFRSAMDCNQWLIRGWQILSGDFRPRRADFGKLISASDLKTVRRALRSSPYRMVCINDDASVTDFETARRGVNRELKRLLPDKCSFEL